MEKKDYTVIIEDSGMASRLKALPITKDIPFDVQEKCPACETLLEICAHLVSGDGSQKVRYGLCSSCGYMGYIDRPTQEWIIDFYSKDWDKEFMRSPDEMREGVDRLKEGGKPSRLLSVKLLEEIGADKDRVVCEIGSGYGQVLKLLEEKGFEKLIGVENSQHRADLVKEVFGIDVLHGGFEEASVQEPLRKMRPIGLFFSHHVFEHTYHPADIIRKVSELQEEGDYLIFSLPNADGEHINYALLYLLHLHSFTKEALEILFNRYGYEMIADNSPDPTNIIIAARKVANPKQHHRTDRNYQKEFLERFRKGFGINESVDDKPYALYWQQRTNEADVATIQKKFSSPLLTRLWWRGRKSLDFVKSRYLKRFTGGHRLLLRKSEKKGSPVSVGCEIQFEDKIHFFIK